MRHPDCYARLHNLWQKKYNTPFQWGKHDCLALALEAIEAVTGERLSTQSNPLPYHSYKSAQRLLQKQPLLDRVEQALEKFDVAQNYASLQSGDIALVAMSAATKQNQAQAQAQAFFHPHNRELASWLALAVLDLCPSGFVLPRLPKGITRINKKYITIVKAWRIA